MTSENVGGLRDARKEAHRLRAVLRPFAPTLRERTCGKWPVAHVDQTPTIEVRQRTDGTMCARWSGVLACGHIWTCPVCSQNLRAKRCERVEAAVRKGGDRWQMLTVTLRHREGMPLKRLLGGLMAAWRRTRQGGKVQQLWSDRVSASVRSCEVTHGENGWHPHLHVLLRTSEWTVEEHELLERKWQAAVMRELGAECLPDDLHGLVWSDPFDAADAGRRASYVAKLGLEIVGLGKDGRAGSRSQWAVARDAAAGDGKSLALWREFFVATKGRRMLELDDRACAFAEQDEHDETAELKEPDEFTPREPVVIEVHQDDLRAVARAERDQPAIFAIMLALAERGGAAAVRERIGQFRARYGPAERTVIPPVTPVWAPLPQGIGAPLSYFRPAPLGPSGDAFEPLPFPFASS